jgi:hypothetical protein
MHLAPCNAQLTFQAFDGKYIIIMRHNDSVLGDTFP